MLNEQWVLIADVPKVLLASFFLSLPNCPTKDVSHKDPRNLGAAQTLKIKIKISIHVLGVYLTLRKH